LSDIDVRLRRTLSDIQQQHLELAAKSGRIKLAPNGQVLLSAVGESAIVWHVPSWKALQTLQHSLCVTCVALSDDCTNVACGAGSGSATGVNVVTIWNAKSGTVTHRLHLPSKPCIVSFSPNGRSVAAVAADGSVAVWDTLVGALRLEIVRCGHVNFINFSLDNKYLACATDNCTVSLWSMATGERIQTLAHGGWVSSIVFSHDGLQLASAEDKAVRVWSTETGRECATLCVKGARAVDFSACGRYLVAATSDGACSVFSRPGILPRIMLLRALALLRARFRVLQRSGLAVVVESATSQCSTGWWIERLCSGQQLPQHVVESIFRYILLPEC
jgi:WD40 repeat protein